MCAKNNTMAGLGDFLKGSSVVASLPTLLYVGFAQYRNRVALLRSIDAEKLQNYLSIPHEMLPIVIGVAYGFAYKTMKRFEKHDDKKIAGTRITLKTLGVGATTGFLLSLVGRFGADLPSKLFGIDRSEAYKVHVIAPLIYMGIFVYVDFLASNRF